MVTATVILAVSERIFLVKNIDFASSLQMSQLDMSRRDSMIGMIL